MNLKKEEIRKAIENLYPDRETMVSVHADVLLDKSLMHRPGFWLTNIKSGKHPDNPSWRMASDMVLIAYDILKNSGK